MQSLPKKITALILLLALIVLSFSGCGSLDLFSDNIMTAPSLSDTQSSIYALLGTDNTNTTLMYPQNGDYRSAIIMKDFTGDGYLDAVGFTMREGESGITVTFMTESSAGIWTIISTIQSTSTQIDKVMFGDVTGDGVTDIVVGWGSAKGLANSASLYYYSGEGMSAYSLGHSYSEIELLDLNGNGNKDIFTVSVATLVSSDSVQNNSSMACLYTFENGELTCSHKCVLYNSISTFSKITLGKSLDNRTCVTVDGVMADGSMITQVLYINPFTNVMLAPLSFSGALDSYNYFYRAKQVALTSRDVDDDGIVEIPMCTYENNEETKIYSTDYAIEWVKFDIAGRSIKTVKTQIYNQEDNYTVTIPDESKDTIRCYRDDTTKTASFYECSFNEYGKIKDRKELFSISVFDKSTWGKLPSVDSDDETEIRSYRGESYTYLTDGKLDGKEVVYVTTVNTNSDLYKNIPYTIEIME